MNAQVAGAGTGSPCVHQGCAQCVISPAAACSRAHPASTNASPQHMRLPTRICGQGPTHPPWGFGDCRGRQLAACCACGSRHWAGGPGPGGMGALTLLSTHGVRVAGCGAAQHHQQPGLRTQHRGDAAGAAGTAVRPGMPPPPPPPELLRVLLIPTALQIAHRTRDLGPCPTKVRLVFCGLQLVFCALTGLGCLGIGTLRCM